MAKPSGIGHTRDEIMFLEITPDNGNTSGIINILRDEDIMTIGDLLAYSEQDLLRMKGIGKGYVTAIKRALKQLGYELRKKGVF